MLLADIIFTTGVYVVFALGLRAMLIDEDYLDNPTKWAIAALWPVFLIKYIFVGVGFLFKNVPKLIKRVFLKWQIVPMFIFKGFSRAMKLLVTGKIPT